MSRVVLALALLLAPLTGCRDPSARPSSPSPAADVACPPASGPPLRGITQIHAAQAITCAVVRGEVACWGANREGRLGDGGTTERRNRPVIVPGLSGVVEVSHGVEATFARTGDGSVWVWGSNEMGDFGDGSPDFHIAWTPRKIAEWGRVRRIQGDIPTCAIGESGRVLCAGRPRFRSTNEDILAPGVKAAPVPGLGDVIDLGAGGGFTCALERDGHVACWGMDNHGQLGDGGGADRAEPVRVRGIEGVTRVAAGSDTACALLRDGTVRCWGISLGGMTANHRVEDWRAPVAIEGVERATQIAVGHRVGCAVIEGGAVRCWGSASYDGQLGDGTADTSPTRARQVRCVEDAIEVTVGGSHACALLRDGTAKCWGSGPYGALGDGSAENRKLPVSVLDVVAAEPPSDRCSAGTSLVRGAGDDPRVEATAEWCELPDGKRHGLYRSRWASGRTMMEGMYERGVRRGRWSDYYQHGELLSEDLYDDQGQPHGVWIAYSRRRVFAFATCFDHGKRVWQVTSQGEAKRRPCP